MKNRSCFSIILLCLLIVLGTGPAAHANTLDKELIYRVSLGKASDVAILLKKRGDANIADASGYSLLFIAASRTDPQAMEVVKTLLEFGADVNSDGGSKNYPLMGAIQSENIDIIRYLLDKGADYRAIDAFGMSVAEYAASVDNPQVNALIDEAINADALGLINARTQSGLDTYSYQLAFHSCALQYFSYYFKSKQDPIPESTQQQTLKLHQDKMREMMTKLAQIFGFQQTHVESVITPSRSAIYQQLESMISNRGRRHNGVGKAGDMDKRCDAIAKPYGSGFFNLEKIESKLFAE